MTILSILVITFGIVSSTSQLLQAHKIFKRKSAKDISILTYSLVITSTIIWIFYGIEINNFIVIITNTIAAINIGFVIIGWLLYGRY